MSSNRVFYAFVIDAALYSVWQAVLLGSMPTATASQRFIPFFGLAAHLLQQPEASQVASNTSSRGSGVEGN